MSLDIGIGDGTHPYPSTDEPLLQLNEGGLYSTLAPFFGRLAEETGEWIDLYGDASFDGRKLAALKRTIAEARAANQTRPDSWDVHVNTRITPIVKKNYAQLTKVELIDCLDMFDRIIARAEALGQPVVCFGD